MTQKSGDCVILVKGTRRYNALVLLAIGEIAPELTLAYVAENATHKSPIREIGRIPHKKLRQNALDAYWQWPNEI